MKCHPQPKACIDFSKRQRIAHPKAILYYSQNKTWPQQTKLTKTRLILNHRLFNQDDGYIWQNTFFNRAIARHTCTTTDKVHAVLLSELNSFIRMCSVTIEIEKEKNAAK